MGPLEPISWNEAEAKALEQNGYLAEIDTPIENLIFEIIKDCKMSFNCSVNRDVAIKSCPIFPKVAKTVS